MKEKRRLAAITFIGPNRLRKKEKLFSSPIALVVCARRTHIVDTLGRLTEKET